MQLPRNDHIVVCGLNGLGSSISTCPCGWVETQLLEMSELGEVVIAEVCDQAEKQLATEGIIPDD